MKDYKAFRLNNEIHAIIEEADGFVISTTGHGRNVMSLEDYEKQVEELPGRYALVNSFTVLGGFPDDQTLTTAYERLATECMLFCQREVTPFEILEGDAGNLKDSEPSLTEGAGFWNLAHPYIERQHNDDTGEEETVIKIILVGYVDVTKVDSPQDIAQNRSLLSHYTPYPTFIQTGEDDEGNPTVKGIYNFDLRPVVYDDPDEDFEEEGELDDFDEGEEDSPEQDDLDQ